MTTSDSTRLLRTLPQSDLARNILTAMASGDAATEIGLREQLDGELASITMRESPVSLPYISATLLIGANTHTIASLLEANPSIGGDDLDAPTPFEWAKTSANHLREVLNSDVSGAARICAVRLSALDATITGDPERAAWLNAVQVPDSDSPADAAAIENFLQLRAAPPRALMAPPPQPGTVRIHPSGRNESQLPYQDVPLDTIGEVRDVPPWARSGLPEGTMALVAPFDAASPVIPVRDEYDALWVGLSRNARFISLDCHTDDWLLSILVPLGNIAEVVSNADGRPAGIAYRAAVGGVTARRVDAAFTSVVEKLRSVAPVLRFDLPTRGHEGQTPSVRRVAIPADLVRTAAALPAAPGPRTRLWYNQPIAAGRDWRDVAGTVGAVDGAIRAGRAQALRRSHRRAAHPDRQGRSLP